MGCLVLKSKGKPQFIDLFSTDSLLSLKLGNYLTVQEAFNLTKGRYKDDLYQDQRLIRLIWPDRLMDAIGQADRVYFSPDGLVHQWAIEYIIPDTTKTCYRLSTTGNLVKRPPSPKMSSALLCGGIHFAADITPVEKDNDYMAYRYLKAKGGVFRELRWTEIEVDSIRACRNNPNDTLLKGDDATDEKVLELLRSHQYDILHFTTHGNFEGEINIQNELRPLPEDIDLSRSALAFAGSETTLRDRYFDEEYSDGLLSGTEISRLDLSKTELVVLNACQTGQGHLTEDGIYGFQRAIKQAGAHSMIVTLWSVFEDSSALLLQFFYEEIEKQPSEKKDIHSASGPHPQEC